VTARTLAAAAAAVLCGAIAAGAQTAVAGAQTTVAGAQTTAPGASSQSAGEPTLCGQPVPPPAQLPPIDSGPLVYVMGLCFSTQNNQSAVEPETYLYYLRLRPSRPSQREWVPFDDAARATIKEDFQRLWATGFLDDLKVEATDYTFPNGVPGKIVTYHIEERSRVRLVKYDGAGDLDQTRIDEALREHGAEIKLDAFLDQGVIRRARTVLRDLLAEKGFAAAAVASAVTPIEGPGKLVSLTFNVTRGPKLVIRDVAFIGNRAVPDADLVKVLKNNRPQGLLSLVTSRGAYNETTYADDAQRVEDFYRDQGYVAVRVGQPEVRTLDDSADGKTRFVQLRIPVYEGRRYRVGTLTFEGQTIVRTEALQQIFKLKPGAWYRQQRLRDGLNKAREIYGSVGHMEFTGYPDLKRRDVPDPNAAGSTPDLPAAAAEANAMAAAEAAPAIVDVVMRLTEGPRYVINRIAFKGNTITRDEVIRRELNLYEGGVFNTEALKHSVRRLNQLGYFKALEGSEKDLKVEKAAGVTDAVDLTFTLEEQNRNSIQFGGGVSQYDGAFFNLAYTTTNLMGKGESLTLTGQKGTRSSIYQVSFTEPYAFNRPVTAGVEVYSRKVDLMTNVNVIGYSEVRSGGNVTLGRQLWRYTRALATYGYEVVDTAVSPELAESLGAGSLSTLFLNNGRYTESRITPAFVYNTVDNPYTPRSGQRLTINMPIAGGVLGGTTSYVRPEAEAIVYVPHTRRTALGVRVNAGFLRPYGNTRDLPYYLRYVMGGEYQIRGVELRSVGPLDDEQRVVGGDKFVLFNAEYYLDVLGPVRALLFHDAGQAFADTERIDLRQLRTSTGVELRVIVPMLNVPFRLIYAWNVYRDTFQPARALKFAVGTTF
jgi:outer membrane protein insertion porin family